METLEPLGRTGLTHRRPCNLDRFHYGAAYYPEHWDTATRREDAVRMAQAGLTVVRMAEFAWDLMEPQEGTFDFSLFARTIDELGRHGIATILCTPTAAPPRWLTLRHPEILRVDAQGHPMQHGSRQHACTTHPTFRRYSRHITGAMASFFANHPHVVGWQTDNELNCHFSECHCEACQQAFREFLHRKFKGDIRALNAAWGCAFWALTFSDFSEIPTPRPGRPAYPNPSHELDYNRFLSDAVARFQHEQVAILRQANPRWWITHNGLFRHIDYRSLFTQDLDFLGFDSYPCFGPPDTRSMRQAFTLDRTRSWSGNFVVPEQQSGPGGQKPYFHDNPEPGEIRRMVYTSIARGADSLLHFRWRTCRFGAEEYWCGILDHDNVPRRRYQEVAQIGRELKVVGPELLGTSVFVDTAVAMGDMNVEDSHQTYPLGLPSPEAVASDVHAALFQKGLAVGGIHPADDLKGIRLYVIPHWAYFDPEWVPNLESFVRGGGTLVIGARCATRTPDNQITPDILPGCLRELAACDITEYGRQNVPELRPLSLSVSGRNAGTALWYEVTTPATDTRVLATWQDRHLTGQPAVTERTLGKGHVFYVGTYLTQPVLDLLLPEFIRASNLHPLWPDSPPSVQVVRREDGRKRLWFFINDGEQEAVVSRTPPGQNLITGHRTGNTLTLQPHDVAVIRED
jgi:beta-galactosidase